MKFIWMIGFVFISLMTLNSKRLVFSNEVISSGNLGSYKPLPFGPNIFDQQNAPKDVSELLTYFTQIFTRDGSQILKIEVRSEGNETQSFALSTVGTHTINATVQRLNQQDQLVVQCYSATFIITDVNECEVQRSHPMHHGCHYSTQCINTNGSYECACHSGTLGGSGISMGQCEGALNTSCCLQGHLGKKEVSNCKAAFQCEKVRCPGDCVPEAHCTLWEKDNRFQYKCVCPCDPRGETQVGNGKKCKGPQPTAYKTKEGTLIGEVEDYCGCQTPITDYCYQVDCGHNADCFNDCKRGKYECRCKKGFKWFAGLGCVDEKLPTLKLRGPNPFLVKQCRSYEELGVDIINDHEVPLSKSVEITYSQPLRSCLPKNGSFEVIYTLDTSWASPGPLVVKETRQVEIVSTNLCTLAKDYTDRCPACITKCSPEAQCHSIGGTYTCSCPKCLQGDGFVQGSYPLDHAPPGYAGGTGCKIDVCPPKLTLSGNNPIYFEIPKCVYISGQRISDTCRPVFIQNLRKEILDTRGQVLCLERGVCAHASDDTGFQVVDRTEHITISLSDLSFFSATDTNAHEFQVLYDVKDAAGNRAETKYLQIIIQEKTLEEVRKEIQQNRGSNVYMRQQCPQVDFTGQDLDQTVKDEIARYRLNLQIAEKRNQDLLEENTDLRRQLTSQEQGFTATSENGDVMDSMGRLVIQIALLLVAVVSLVAIPWALYIRFRS